MEPESLSHHKSFSIERTLKPAIDRQQPMTMRLERYRDRRTASHHNQSEPMDNKTILDKTDFSKVARTEEETNDFWTRLSFFNIY